LQVAGIAPDAPGQLWRVDADHGNVVKTFDAMGRPATPSRDQITRLQEAARPSPPEQVALKNGSLTFNIPPQGLVVLEVRNGKLAH
jgi:xylan 1,4-beta-xylosidase